MISMKLARLVWVPFMCISQYVLLYNFLIIYGSKRISPPLLWIFSYSIHGHFESLIGQNITFTGLVNMFLPVTKIHIYNGSHVRLVDNKLSDHIYSINSTDFS